MGQNKKNQHCQDLNVLAKSIANSCLPDIQVDTVVSSGRCFSRVSTLQNISELTNGFSLFSCVHLGAELQEMHKEKWR